MILYWILEIIANGLGIAMVFTDVSEIYILSYLVLTFVIFMCPLQSYKQDSTFQISRSQYALINMKSTSIN